MKPLINKADDQNKAGDKSAMYLKLKRLTGADGETPLRSAYQEQDQSAFMKVVVRPNPFQSSITLDITSEQGKNVIIRIFNEDGRLVKMFSWFLLKGVNVTTVNDMDNLSSGEYQLDMIDQEGKLLFCTKLTRE